MELLEQYLNKIRDRGNEQLAESIQQTVDGIAPTYLENFSFCTHEVGLLFGNVQSGKTGQMFGVICAAADLGFPVFFILTTNNVVLQQQTIERVRDDLDGFCICDEYDTGLFVENNLMMPTIVVLKKEVRVLRQWSNILASSGFMAGNPLFIIDDEADAASLNTLVNRNRQSSINKYLDEIKGRSASSIYLQVTGTPQALFLQSMASGWHPYFTFYFRPGKAYLGGNFFFPASGKPDCIKYIDTMTDPLKNAILHHLCVSAQLLGTGRKVCNCLIHPSVRKAVHSKYQRDVKKALDSMAANAMTADFEAAVHKEYDEMFPASGNLLPFSQILASVRQLLLKKSVSILVMNANGNITSDQYASGSNIIIGGNTLGRGVTFGGLHTIYYTRTAKKPQADTMWQHSRMFGYDRDSGLIQIFIDQQLYKLFSDINQTNNSLISQVEKGLDNIRIIYPAGLNPTRKNVIDNKRVSLIPGGTNYYPNNPGNNTIEQLNDLLAPFDEKTESYQVSLRLMREIFSHITTDEDFKLDAFSGILDTMIAEKPIIQGVLIVRRNRNITKGTGALLSPNDWDLGVKNGSKVVLTMYQMSGDLSKGWNGLKLWVPNIRLPDGSVYYNVEDMQDDG